MNKNSWRRAVGRSKLRPYVQSVAVAIALLFTGQAAQAKTFGWKATGKSGVVYVIGSVHVLSKDFYPLNPALEAAYKDSDLLVEELNLDEAMGLDSQMSFLSRGMLPSTTSLDKVVSPATYALLSKRLAGSGIPIEPLMLLKPWMVALMLEQLEWQKAGLDPELGLDKHFFDQAKRDGKAVQGFETVEYQLSLFDGMPAAEQEHLLAETLKDIDTEQSNMSKLIEAWRTGDATTVERIVLADLKPEPQLYQRLLAGRNRNWMPTIDALLLRKGHALIVVGAAHLVGADGLIAMLKAKGYTVEQL
jgi:uncharacterized protein YbaP (TraB family)